ncbi:nucleotidyltransferase family protein [Neptunomonas antarctica]|uniref:Uncharacterized nucleotidyltransferase n=1 Tax=Neptunomonas antarctica TaxID=619304 RepID=A0A1N7L304_9GAMM|nr:nucleotidyltransferase family protein [Neptunomonas antarctica]SIS68040.1 Uncharacterised nucleotidyltransferase [Neptunomonas antarctica]
MTTQGSLSSKRVTTEFGLLCALFAPHTAESESRVRAFFTGDLDWNKAVQTAYDHSLAPLFCSILLSGYQDFIPADLKDAMQFHLDRHCAQATEQSAALVNLLGQLEDRGVEAIPFKGPTLSLRAFNDANLRLFADLDLLVRDTDVESAVACLISLGYQHASNFNQRTETAVRRYGGQYNMQHQGTGVCVEPHWALTPSTMAIDLDYPLLWRRAVRKPFLQRTVWAFSPEDEVLMLCIHASKECWRSLKPVVDLAGFLNKHAQLDWNSLIMMARQTGCLRMLLLGVELCYRLLGVNIEPDCQNLIVRDKVINSLSEKLIDIMNKCDPPPANPYRVDHYSLAIRERYSDKLRFILRTTCTPRATHYELVNLPPTLRYLYVPIKLVFDYLILPVHRTVARITSSLCSY